MGFSWMRKGVQKLVMGKKGFGRDCGHCLGLAMAGERLLERGEGLGSTKREGRWLGKGFRKRQWLGDGIREGRKQRQGREVAAAAGLGPREGDMVLATWFKRPMMGDDNGMSTKEGIGAGGSKRILKRLR